MKSPFENVEGRFSLQNLPMEGRKDILPLNLPWRIQREILFSKSPFGREKIFSRENFKSPFKIKNEMNFF